MNWFEDESYWRELYPYMFHEARWTTAESDVDRVLALSGVASGSVLDLCCGPARHSALLALKGFAVTAVDRSPYLLERARENAKDLPIEFVEADAREFVRPEAFELAVNLFTSFGYFETREEDQTVLRNVRESLRTGGVLVMDLMGREQLAQLRSLNRWDRAANGAILVTHATPLEDWSRYRNCWLLVEGDRAKRWDFELNLYSGGELRQMLEQAGFRDVRLFGSLAGTPYDATAMRLVAVAKAG